jgi:hypothetical protein
MFHEMGGGLVSVHVCFRPCVCVSLAERLFRCLNFLWDIWQRTDHRARIVVPQSLLALRRVLSPAQCRAFNIEGMVSRFKVQLTESATDAPEVLATAQAVACDGCYLYVHTIKLGLLKISTGQNGVAAGLVMHSRRDDVFLHQEPR